MKNIKTQKLLARVNFASGQRLRELELRCDTQPVPISVGEGRKGSGGLPGDPSENPEVDGGRPVALDGGRRATGAQIREPGGRSWATGDQSENPKVDGGLPGSQSKIQRSMAGFRGPIRKSEGLWRVAGPIRKSEGRWRSTPGTQSERPKIEDGRPGGLSENPKVSTVPIQKTDGRWRATGVKI